MRLVVLSKARFKLYHVTDRENVLSIREHGIRPSRTECPNPAFNPPGRELAVFATDRDTQKRTGAYRSEDDAPYSIVEFEPDEALVKKGMVGDIYGECGQFYAKTLTPLREFIADYPESLRLYVEAEVYFPGATIPPGMITNVYPSEENIP